MIAQLLGKVLCTIAAVLLLPAIICLLYGESPFPFLAVTLMMAACGAVLLRFRPKLQKIYAAEGFVVVGLSWILLSLFGALPFVLSGDIPNYIDAVFETVSGFTTTGASNLPDVEALSRGAVFWRSLTHFLGGMGVLVFIMAVLPMSGSRSIHIMRAEVPGPIVGKLVPSARKTAMLLYGIYIAMTVLEMILLICGGMSVFDSVIHAFGTAGTGGFSSRALSIGYYDSAYIDAVVTIFMILFGVNFNLYYLILLGKGLEALKSEELHWYLGVVVFSAVSIALNLGRAYGDFFHNLRYSFFQVASIISTTGYGTADFNLWPTYSKWLLVLLMFFGACAGSTGGGLKFSRILILGKSIRLELRKQLRPHSVSIERLEGKPIGEATIHSTLVFFACYLFLFFLGTVIVSTDGLDLTTTFTSVVACLSNIGPGLELVGPMGSYIMFSPLSKIVLSLLMLLGRLEIFPILMLFSPRVWKK
jgi:trk system potassium uptake protein TrkH